MHNGSDNNEKNMSKKSSYVHHIWSKQQHLYYIINYIDIDIYQQKKRTSILTQLKKK